MIKEFFLNLICTHCKYHPHAKYSDLAYPYKACFCGNFLITVLSEYNTHHFYITLKDRIQVHILFCRDDSCFKIIDLKLSSIGLPSTLLELDYIPELKYNNFEVLNKQIEIMITFQ